MPINSEIIACDERYMQLAFLEAQKAYALGEIPVGCVIVADGQIVEVMFHTEKETVLSAELPPIVDMEVTYTEPGVRGDTASTNSLKAATVNTGATIKVPLFINTGDKIRVDTRTREYYERIK